MGKASITIAVSSVFNGNGFDKAIESATKLGSKLSRMEKLTAASASSMAQNVGKMGLEWEAAGKRIESLGKKMADLGDNLTRSVTVPMAAVGTYAGAMAVEFDTALANVRKTSDMTEAQLDRLAQSALELSKTQPVDAKTILNIEALGAQLGISNDRLEDFAKTVSGLDIATDMNAEAAATEMARFANIVGMTEDQFDNYGSTLVAIGNNMATTESEVSQMAQRFASAGAQAGLSEAQILGMSAAMSSLGIKAEMGGSALSQVFVSIGKAVSQGGDALDAFAARAGMSAEEFRSAWQDNAAGAFNSLVEGIGGATAAGEDMNAIMGELGFTQIRQSDVMRRLAGSTEAVTGKTSVLSQALELSTDAWERNTALQNEVDQRNESMASRLDVLKNKVEAIAITVGRPLVDAVIDALEALDPVMQVVSDAALAFADMDEAGQRNILMWAGLAAAAGPVLSVTGRITQGVGHLVTAFGETASKVAVVGDAMNNLDGANLRTYASSKSLASQVGLSGNAAVKAAGGVDNYVKAWDGMVTAAGRAEKAENAMRDAMKAAESATGGAKTGLLRKAAAHESDMIAAEADYKASAKLVSAFGDSTKEAERAAKGIKSLEPALDEVKNGMGASGKVLADYNKTLKATKGATDVAALSMGRNLANGARLAAASIGNFVKACAPMLALTAVTAVIGGIVEEFKRMEEHERDVEAATRSFGDLMVDAGRKAESSASGFSAASRSMDEVKKSSEGSLSAVAKLGDSIVESFADIGARDAELSGYVKTIEDLGGKSRLTASQQADLKAAIDGYNRITGQAVSITDESNSTLSVSTDELKKNADAWRRNAEAQAAGEMLTEAYKEQYKAQQDLSDAQEKYNEKVEWYLSANADLTRAEAERLAQSHDSYTAMKDSESALKGVNEQIDGLTAKTVLAASALSEDFKVAVEQLPPSLQQVGIDMAAKLSEGVDAGRVTLDQAVSFMNQGVITSVSSLPLGMQQKGMEVAMQLAAGISSGQISVQDATSFMKMGVDDTISTLPMCMQASGLAAATALATEISNGQISVTEAADLLRQAASGGVSTLPTDMSSTATDAVNGFSTAIASGQQGTLEAATGLSYNANSGISGLPGSFQTTGDSSQQNLAAALSAGTAGANAASAQLSASAQGGVAGLPGSMGGSGSAASSLFASGIGSNVGSVQTNAAKVADAAKGMKNAGNMYESGSHLVSNFASGISSGISWVAQKAREVAQAAKNALGFSVPKEGPWSGMERGGETSGLHLAQNWARGMERGIPDIERASLRMAHAAGDKAPLSYAGGETSGLHAKGGIMSAIPEVKRSAAALAAAAASPVPLGSSDSGGSSVTNNTSNNTYVLNINGARAGSMSRRSQDALRAILSEFDLTNQMGVL